MILKDLRDTLISTINQSGLPVDAVYYVMKDLMGEVETLYSQEMAAEAVQKQAQEKKEQEKVANNEVKEAEIVEEKEEN